MKREEIIELAEGTADAAFVLDQNGVIAAWNSAAEQLFLITAEEALGLLCSQVLHGVDECGRVCGTECVVKEHSAKRHPVSNYDVQVKTPSGKRWCSMSVLMPLNQGTAAGYTLHVARPNDLQKRFEHLMRDFVVAETEIPPAQLRELVAIKRSPTQLAELSKRETEILRLLAKGRSTAQMAVDLFISPTTVNNHVQRILKKLSAHTRLEAVRRAEHARLI